jgi:hypothetical protein
MDIEELTNSQIILVTILVSFVISIGTAIITVALVKDTPITMPSVVNQVIQKTVEKESVVVSTTTPSGVQNVQVVIKEDDTVATLAGLELARQRKMLTDEGEVLGSGFFLSPSLFVTELDAESIHIKNDADSVSLVRLKDAVESTLRFYISQEKVSDTKAVAIAKLLDLKIGQKVVALSPLSKTISIGYVTSLSPTDTSVSVETSIEISNKNSGTLLYTLDGKLIGVLVVREDSMMLVPAESFAAII